MVCHKSNETKYVAHNVAILKHFIYAECIYKINDINISQRNIVIIILIKSTNNLIKLNFIKFDLGKKIRISDIFWTFVVNILFLTEEKDNL